MASHREMSRAIRRDIDDSNKKLAEALKLSAGLASKLASVVVHADEMLSAKGHHFDKAALNIAVSDPEVQAWIKALGPLAPVKR